MVGGNFWQKSKGCGEYYFISSGKPAIVEEPRDVEVNFGGTASFHCKVDGDPKPEIIWLRNRYWFDIHVMENMSN